MYVHFTSYIYLDCSASQLWHEAACLHNQVDFSLNPTVTCAMVGCTFHADALLLGVLLSTALTVDVRSVNDCAGEVPYPAFLSRHWFQHQNASALRQHIRNLILQLFTQEKRLPDDHPTVLNAVTDMADYQANTKEPKYVHVLH